MLRFFKILKVIGITLAIIIGCGAMYIVWEIMVNQSYAFEYTRDNHTSVKLAPAIGSSNHINEPEELVRSWVEDLGSGRFSSAFGKSRNPNWGSFEHFKSTRGHGGIVATTIFNSKTLAQTNTDAIVKIKYLVRNPHELKNEYRNCTYIQYHWLKRFEDGWKIVDANLSPGKISQMSNMKFQR